MLVIPPTDLPLDDVVFQVLTHLQSFGDLYAYVDSESYAGDEDIRVVACRDHPVVSVELLCCTPADAPPPSWYAVRMAREERCVWRGPDRDAPVVHVVRFIDDLLRMDPPSLTDRYEPLG